ncbi:hypothetical protein [Jiangella asiatica]|uniref:DUF998 domain-containing protein n=1 Tax=Jiangella asiatica TaxID=2530372 RepID=A0A4R5DLY9_9ACTN|nr:hypothetical protein [Jiangella asiatica]TDE13084.1 hypothetical protein E1269_06750 [Jiangella asiatica]
MSSAITHARAGADVRRLGLACAISGVLMLGVSVFTVFPPDGVPDDQWSYPQTPSQLLAISLVLAVAHALSVGGFIGARRLAVAGGGRASRVGFTGAVAGLIALGFCELLSGLIAEEPLDSGVAAVVGTLFGLSSLLFAAGAIIAGIGVIRAGRWPGWGRWLVLATGVVIVVLVTPANAVGDPVFRWVSLALWSVLFIPLGFQVARGLRPRS